MELNLAAGARLGALVACTPVERDRRWPRPPARGPARGGAAGMRLGSDGGGRDADWQSG